MSGIFCFLQSSPQSETGVAVFSEMCNFFVIEKIIQCTASHALAFVALLELMQHTYLPAVIAIFLEMYNFNDFVSFSFVQFLLI